LCRFVERDVRLGDAIGNDVVVVSGVQVGDKIATAGSFSVRAERDRVGITVNATPQPTAGVAPTSARPAGSAPSVQEAKVLVTEQRYEPAKLMRVPPMTTIGQGGGR